MKPPVNRVSHHRIGGKSLRFEMAALHALESTFFETIGVREDAGCDHPHGALWAARTLEREKFWVRFSHSDHHLRGKPRSK